MDETYPLTYSVDYPDRELNRLTTFFRIFTVIPIAIVLGSRRPRNLRRLGRRRERRMSRAGGLLVGGPAADDPVPQEVPALVVRLEPRAAALLERVAIYWRC